MDTLEPEPNEVNTSAIVRVPFCGDELEATRDERGVWVSLKRMCENLGVASQSQAAKLKNKAWAVTTMIVATGPDGKTYEMTALHLDSVPMWLATIEASKVDPEIRGKLIAYQCECARVLRDHFFGPITQSQPQYDFEDLVRMTANSTLELALPLMEQLAEKVASRILFNGAMHNTGTIGEDKAKLHILDKIYWVAQVRALGDRSRTRFRKERAYVDMRLRSAMQIPMAFKWRDLPEARLNQAIEVLEWLAKDANELARNRWAENQPAETEQLGLELAEDNSDAEKPN